MECGHGEAEACDISDITIFSDRWQTQEESSVKDTGFPEANAISSLGKSPDRRQAR